MITSCVWFIKTQFMTTQPEEINKKTEENYRLKIKNTHSAR